jgi:hypothetical protein
VFVKPDSCCSFICCYCFCCSSFICISISVPSGIASLTIMYLNEENNILLYFSLFKLKHISRFSDCVQM